MLCRPRILFFIPCCIALSSFLLPAQDDTGWRISPEKINIQMGQDRRLQLLDDSAEELHGAMWAVDNPDVADIEEVDGYAVVHSKGVGTVRVSAALNGEMRFRDIRIWSSLRPMPIGTTFWGLHPIGREIGDIPAVPGDGPTIFSLEQTSDGRTYLRADEEDGIQAWTWLLPERTHDVELVCGDWMGGALISANHSNFSVLYTVGKDGKTRWKYTLPGVRKAHAYTLTHVVHILSQSPDGEGTKLTGIDEETGAQKFELTIPASHERQVNVRREGTRILCVPRPVSNPIRTIASRLFVNIDGFAYVAFTQNEWKLSAAKCAAGSVIEPHDVTFARDEKVVLWQIHDDGSYRSSIVEEAKNTLPLTEPTSVPSPTGGIIPDGLDGVLLPIRWSHNFIVEDVHGSPDEFIYRIDPNGEVVYKLAMPKYEGPLHDEMVLGEDDIGFTTRGRYLIAFNVRSGKENWRWDSGTTDISVYAALANGHCLIETPTGMVEVESATKAKQFSDSKLMMGWHGDTYRKHN
jgi:outer membrane protein assembly factor BamB